MTGVQTCALPISERLKNSGIRVAYFVDPEPKQIESSRMAGAEVVELHTGTYADALSQKQKKYELNRIRECAAHGTKIGLKVHAGHGLHYENTAQIAAISEILELNIGHAIVAKSLDLGIAKAVADMKKIRSEEHTSELQSRTNLVCRLLLEKKNKYKYNK